MPGVAGSRELSWFAMGWIDADVIEAVERLFADPYPALAAAGAPGFTFPESWLESPSDPGDPLLETLCASLGKVRIRSSAEQSRMTGDRGPARRRTSRSMAAT